MPRVIPITAAPDADPEIVSLYAAHEKIYPRSVSGWFANWRWATVFLTQLVFYGVPWLSWGERQAVLFDLGERRFYLFGLVLYPQDFIYLAALLVICALSLFLFTALAGRLWCGYACPQTVYTEIFLWIEKRAEGDRQARMRRDAQPWSADKLVRKTIKHALWLALALWTGFTFVGYFTPIQELGMALTHFDMSPWEVFWTGFYGVATYGNAGFLREQVCLHMCPYARFQSAMFDKDTLIVTYDATRGEPRGARSRKADPAAINLGACIDCTLCVQVCPTGIDIRQGLQYECIGCGACADVCDSVMDKMNYPRGLIRYTTQNALVNRWTPSQAWKRALRPRMLVYGTVLITIVTVTLTSLFMRTPFKVDVVRDRSIAGRMVTGGQVENVYRLQIRNATETAQHFKINVQGLPRLAWSPSAPIDVAATQSRWVAVRVQAPADAAWAGSHPIQFDVESLDGAGRVSEKAVFLLPK